MLDDLKKLLGDDPQALGQLQKLTQQGEFNPFSLFAGDTRFHSVFLAPYSPSLAEGVKRFLADGTGPLVGIAEMFQKQGASPAEAQQSARAMFSSAHGMCVVVVANDQGLDTIPQLFFGHLEDSFIEHAVKTCGDAFPAKDRLGAALRALRGKRDAGWPMLFAGGSGDDSVAFWTGLAADLVGGLDQALVATPNERLRDLAHWTSSAVGALERAGKKIPTARLAPAIRCGLIGGEVADVLPRLEALIGQAEEEDVVHLLTHLADAAIARGMPQAAGDWFATRLDRLTAAYPASYDLLLPLFRLRAAAGVDAAELLATAQRLVKANRKAARHDLTREPIWRVTAPEPGEVLETAAAGDAIGRSPAFIVKRLEQGTIPSVRQDDQVRLPARALRAWKAVMDAHQLLD
ncbi:MAG: hypothetical protein H0W72_04205 [Planctomycetes bacterium]|nr:hypothetical protein [Planctomycetota bacterium]